MHSSKREIPTERIVSLIDSDPSADPTSQESEEGNRTPESTEGKEPPLPRGGSGNGSPSAWEVRMEGAEFSAELVSRRRNESEPEEDNGVQHSQASPRPEVGDAEELASQFSEDLVEDGQPIDSTSVDEVLGSGEGGEDVEDGGERGDSTFRVPDSQRGEEDNGRRHVLEFRVRNSLGSPESTPFRRKEEGGRLRAEDGGGPGHSTFRVPDSQDGREDNRSQHVLEFRVRNSLGSAESTPSRERKGGGTLEKRKLAAEEHSLDSRRSGLIKFRVPNSQESVESWRESAVGGDKNQVFKARDSIGSVSSIEEVVGEERQPRELTARASQASVESVEEVEEGEQGERQAEMGLQGSFRKPLLGSTTAKEFGKASAARKLQFLLQRVDHKDVSASMGKSIGVEGVGSAEAPERVVEWREMVEILESTSQKRWSVSEEEIVESLDSDDDLMQREDSAGISARLSRIPPSPTGLWANFREVLRCAPPEGEMDEMFGTPWHDTVSLSCRLDIALKRLKDQRKKFERGLTKGLPSQLQCLVVEILHKKLDAAQLTTCQCKLLQSPQGSGGRSDEAGAESSQAASIDVIFSSKMSPELQLNIGGVVRIYPPWQELLLGRNSSKVVLCTFFCEVEI